MKNVWNFLGEIKVAFVLLVAAAATLLTGAFYAEHNFSLFRELNRMRVQDWLAVHLAAQPEITWWVPLLFVIMAALGINTFICASNRFARLWRQRRTLLVGRFFYLLAPSLVHFLFITIMLGHLATFGLGKWQAIPITAGGQLTIVDGGEPYRVQSVQDRFFPETAALHNRIAQTVVTLTDGDEKLTHLQYARPVFKNDRFLLLDKTKPGHGAAKKKLLPGTDEETCNKAHVYVEKNRPRIVGRQLLLIVSDPGLVVIVSGLTLIMILMVGYFLAQTRGNRRQNQTGTGARLFPESGCLWLDCDPENRTRSL